MISLRLTHLLLLLYLVLPPHTFAQYNWTIENPMNLNWPGELVSFESEKPPVSEAKSMQVGDTFYPIQMEETDKGTRYWSYIAVPSAQRGQSSSVQAKLSQQSVADGIRVSEQGNYYLIENGVYQFRLRNYDGDLKETIPLADLSHWIGGMRTLNQEGWDGRAWFDSSARVTAAETRLVAKGPVFADFLVTYTFENAGESEIQLVDAQPLASGKQTHLWEPNEFPVEKIPKRERHYEVLVRFVMQDTWIDVNERFHFPRDPDHQPWGISQYWLQWGEAVDAPSIEGFDGNPGLVVDTVTWVRWFLYDQFGGNTRQQYVPAQPRDDQKGRPFALLRPRWNQGGGGAQDFVVTGGGNQPPSLDWLRKRYLGKAMRQFTKNAGDAEKAKLESLEDRLSEKSLSYEVRFQAAREIGEMVGKNVDPLSEEYSEANPAAGIVAAFASKWVGPYPATIATYALDNNRARARFPLIDGERSGRHYGQRAYGLLVGPRSAFTNLNDLVRRHTDWTLTAEVNKYILNWDRGGDVKGMELPGADLFIQRRYQDDFLNPTSRATRDLIELGKARREAGDNVPIGGKWQAALGYIFTDADHWPGWHNGWSPGNPNFHTDKYMGAVYTASALPDHPHAKEWLEYGWRNLEDDISKSIVGPDGVGAECPGYSGYSLAHQLDIMRTLRDTGLEEVLDRAESVKKSGVWHRKLITPYDYRLELRHEAPHGDTHRWTAGLAVGFGKLAYLFQNKDPAYAAEMLGTFQMLVDSGAGGKKMNVDAWLGGAEIKIQPMDPKRMDWSSEAFEGFGVIMRDDFGSEKESFLSMKAGYTGGHYHNDDLAFHFYSDGAPVSLDYNCSYEPRGDHAGLHNSMTFGNTGELRNNTTGKTIEGMEQLYSRANVLTFKATDQLDLVVAEKSGSTLNMSPLFPEDHEFNRSYPSRKTDLIKHRRTLMFVKHDNHPDYLVVRDQTVSSEPQQINLHLLAREVSIDGNRVRARGQWDTDMDVAFFPIDGDGDLRVEERSWYYADTWLKHPGEAYTPRVGESQSQWADRMANLDRVPDVNWKREYRTRDEWSQEWMNLIKATNGQALIPPPGWQEEWHYGEYQKWLRVHSTGGEDVVWVLFPRDEKAKPSEIDYDASTRTLTVKHSGGVDRFDFSGDLKVEIDGKSEILLREKELRALK